MLTIGVPRHRKNKPAPPEPQAPALPPHVLSAFHPMLIDLDADVRDKRELLELAVATMQRAYGLDSAPILRALSRREEAGSTALGEGVAIPHARIHGIAQPLIMFLRTRNPIPFDAPDGNPVSLVLVILVPADGASDDHLLLLAHAASMLSRPAFRTCLATTQDARVAQRAFTEFREV